MGTLELQPRDREILLHVSRYRITTSDTLHRLFFEDVSLEAVKTTLRRLRGTLLVSRPLSARQVYYQLSLEATRLLGEPEEMAKPLGRQALPRAYGVLVFACHGPTRRRRFTREEFARDWPELVDQGLPYLHHDYYLDVDEEGHKRLGRILIDLGGDYRRFLRKCAAVLREGMRFPLYRELLREHRLALALVAAESSKADRLRGAIRARPLGVRTLIETAPGLTELLHTEVRHV